MKTTLLSLLAAALTGLVFAQTNPLQPAPSAIESQPLERWLGDWTFETTSPCASSASGASRLAVTTPSRATP